MPYFQMVRLALKWALTQPPTTRYPFEPRRLIDQSRGQLVFTKDNCVYCTVCAKKCPAGALSVNRALKQFTLDRLGCICCGYCVELCPKDSLAFSPAHAPPALAKNLETYHG
jgi:formate hydrogenlyase subunit 6/NADH:ubiquinone oxidoreductase subunit I